MTKAELHKQISYVKSVLRLLGYALLFFAVFPAALVLIVSEALGIGEEYYGA